MGGFPALAIRPPASPLEQYGQLSQLRGMQQEQQLRQLQIQQSQLALKDQDAVRQAFLAHNGVIDDEMIKDAAERGASPQTLQGLQQHQVQMKTQLAGMNEAQLKLADTQINNLRGLMEPVYNAKDEDKPGLWAKNKAIAASDPQRYGQQVSQLPDQFPGKDAGELLFTMLEGHGQQVKEQLDQRKAAAEEQQAAARKQASETGAQAEAFKEKTFGTITDLERYKQQQENYRATLARQANNANAIGRQGLENLQKQGDTYTQFLSTANSIKNSIAAAKNGNEMAAAVAPLQGVLFVTTAEGVKRINQTELSGVEGAGSIAQRVEGALGKAVGKGPLSDQLKNDLYKLVDMYGEAKYKIYQNQTNYTKQLHGLPSETPVMNKDGSFGPQGQQPQGDFFSNFGGKKRQQ